MTGTSLLDPDDAPAVRAVLTALSARLQAEHDGATDAARAVDLDDPIGRLSRMDAIQQQQMAAAGQRAVALRLRQFDAALDRLDAGTYGACVACGDDIDPRRLAARPEVPFCVACTARRGG